MAQPSPWPAIHQERQALIADLEKLSDDQWTTASWCAPWSVEQVLGHMAATAKITMPGFLGGIIASGFRFTALQDKGVARETEGGPEQTLANFANRLDATTHPPGPVDTLLGETIVHGEDIRGPLGIAHQYDVDAMTRVADFYKGSNLIIGSKKRINGLSLRATDAEWSTGSGPEVSGPLVSLLMAMTGRKQALDALQGDGVAVLRERP